RVATRQRQRRETSAPARRPVSRGQRALSPAVSSATVTGPGLLSRHTLLALALGVPLVSVLALLAPEHADLAIGIAASALVAALRLCIAGGVVIALLSIAFAGATRFAPAYPLLNKNYAGDLLAAAVLLALLAPREVVALGRLRVPAVLLLAAGLAATQSRGA